MKYYKIRQSSAIYDNTRQSERLQNNKKAIEYTTIQYNMIQYKTIQYRTIQDKTKYNEQHNITQ